MASLSNQDPIALARVCRERGDADNAIRICREAISAGANSWEIHDLLGEALLERREPGEALQCFRTAIELDPTAAPAHNNLGRALNNLGHLDAAANAFAEALRLDPLCVKAQVNAGHVLRRSGRLADAIDAFERATGIDGKFVSAHRNLGITLMMLEEPQRAAASFRRCLELAPQDVDAWINLGIAEHALFDMPAARDAYEHALSIDPRNARAHLNLGLVFAELRRTDDAERAFQKALALAPGEPDAMAELAALYEESNRITEAHAMAVRGLTLDPTDPRLLLEAAKCDRRQGDPEGGLRRLAHVEIRSLPPRVAQQVQYELGALYDRLDRPDDAYGHFQEANRLARHNWRVRNVDADRYLDRLDALLAYFADADPTGWPAAPALESAAPIFLIGFPRSGTTLTDLVLDSHPQLQSMEEKPTINLVIDEIEKTSDGYPAALALLDAETIEKLRKVYFDAVDRFVQREPDTLLIDKLPIRTAHVGLIWRLFPQSKILCATRHPCDVLLSGFMQNYVMNDAFANFFTLADAVKVYDKVMRLWALYEEKLPLDVNVCRYEDMVDDLETQARDLLRFLGLDWDSSVLRYRERALQRGRINTNSYHQVTEPIYKRSRYRWLKYERYFQPFMETLAPHIRRFGYDG